MHMHAHSYIGWNFLPFLFTFVSENIPSPKKFKLSFCAFSVNPLAFSCTLEHHHLILAPSVFHCPLNRSPQQINTEKCLLFPAKGKQTNKTNVFNLTFPPVTVLCLCHLIFLNIHIYIFIYKVVITLHKIWKTHCSTTPGQLWLFHSIFIYTCMCNFWCCNLHVFFKSFLSSSFT